MGFEVENDLTLCYLSHRYFSDLMKFIGTDAFVFQSRIQTETSGVLEKFESNVRLYELSLMLRECVFYALHFVNA